MSSRRRLLEPATRARAGRAKGIVLAGAVFVSDQFARALRLALAAAQQTDGLVDPTLLGALEAAGYDRDFASLGWCAEPPGRGMPGRWREVRLTGRVLERPRGVLLDLN